jgi:hypothetical protein
MAKRSALTYVNINDLKLDINNPRFGELYKGSTNEDDLIEYLFNEEAADEIARAIVSRNEFYEDKALWVIKDKVDGKYIVKDGNRRCAAIKALNLPGKYKLGSTKTTFSSLPVYEYYDEDELKSRIGEEHTASLFRNWERIAKALQIVELADMGKTTEINNLDSKPGDFIKLGTFYREAVKYGNENLRKQIRRGKGKTGGKTIIYERLFRDAKACGYKFKNSPSFNIDIFDRGLFENYIKALVKYLELFPETKTSDLDDDRNWIKKLRAYGFDAYPEPAPASAPTPTPAPAPAPTPTPSAPTGPSPAGNGGSSPSPSGTPAPTGTGAVPAASGGTPTSAGSAPTKRGSVKKTPDIKRKKLPLGLKDRIDEYFKIDSIKFPNSKIAMARVTYECVLKFVVENTKHGAILFKNAGHFGSVYTRRPWTNFEEMNKKFIELITNVGIAQAFRNFDFDKMHQTIHNYHVSGTTLDADQIKSNLIVLLEFLLQDEPDLLNSLDRTKIR